eukprot:767937-Hanusia_phi.AAC.3
MLAPSAWFREVSRNELEPSSPHRILAVTPVPFPALLSPVSCKLHAEADRSIGPSGLVYTPEAPPHPTRAVSSHPTLEFSTVNDLSAKTPPTTTPSTLRSGSSTHPVLSACNPYRYTPREACGDTAGGGQRKGEGAAESMESRATRGSEDSYNQLQSVSSFSNTDMMIRLAESF